jgi:hypothetical protein
MRFIFQLMLSLRFAVIWISFEQARVLPFGPHRKQSGEAVNILAGLVAVRWKQPELITGTIPSLLSGLTDCLVPH